MKTLNYGWLLGRALYELVRYELIVWLCGSARILRQLRQQNSGGKPSSAEPSAVKLNAAEPNGAQPNAAGPNAAHRQAEAYRTPRPGSLELERTICETVLLATCFYWKPVLCLQRAVCTVRLLRRHGIVARLVIGYRPSPFFSHAWVEVDGRVVYGSPVYQKRLTPLHIA